MKIPLQMEAITCLPQIDTFYCEWNTKEGTGNALHVQLYGKRHLLGWSDVEKQQKKSNP